VRLEYLEIILGVLFNGGIIQIKEKPCKGSIFFMNRFGMPLFS